MEGQELFRNFICLLGSFSIVSLLFLMIKIKNQDNNNKDKFS